MKNLGILFLLLTLCFYSCQKDEVTDIAINTPTITTVEETMNEGRKRLAKALAKAITNEAFHDYLVKETDKERFGDREVVYAAIKDEVVPGTDMTVAEILTAAEQGETQSNDKDLITGATFFSSALVDSDPGVTVFLYVPEGMVVSNTNSVNRVAFVTNDFDEHTATTVPFYTSIGQLQTIDADIAYPSMPFFVVKEHETLLPVITATGLTIRGTDAPIDGKPYVFEVGPVRFYDYYVVWGTTSSFDPIFPGADDVDEDGDGYSPGFPGILNDPDDTNPCVPDANSQACQDLNDDPSGDCGSADRDTRNNREELVRWKFANTGAYHFALGCAAWLDGRPEFEITCIAGFNPDAPELLPLRKVVTDRRRYFRRNGDLLWYNYRDRNSGVPLLFYNWSLDTYADPMLYQWVEIDKSDLSGELSLSLPKVKFKIPNPFVDDEYISLDWTPASFKIKWNPQNEDLGNDLVYYCDDANGLGEMYNTGSILFNMKEKE